MEGVVQNRDECLKELELRLEELNVQEFKLNEHNFELEERIALMQKSMLEKESAAYQLQQ